jgi:mannan endo-1,4-beta-mannosidase
VDYLRQRRGVHHLLIAYSPGITVERDYFWRWPGNQYVDVMGLDKYVPSVSMLSDALRSMVNEAKKRSKIAALTETGLERVTDPNYWTRNFLNPIKNDPVMKNLSYAMVWRNSSDSSNHYFAPYHGHPSVPDFLAMTRDSYVLMAGDQIKSYFVSP